MGKKDRGGKNSKRKRREQGFNSRGNSIGKRNYASGKVLETMTTEKWAEIKSQKEQQPIQEEVSLFDANAIYGLEGLLTFYHTHNQEATTSSNPNYDYGRNLVIDNHVVSEKTTNSVLLIHDFRLNSGLYHNLAIEYKWVVCGTTLTTEKDYALPKGLTGRLYNCKNLPELKIILNIEFSNKINEVQLNNNGNIKFHFDEIQSVIKERAKPLQDGEYIDKPIVIFGTHKLSEDNFKYIRKSRRNDFFSSRRQLDDYILVVHDKSFPLFLLDDFGIPDKQEEVRYHKDKVVSHFKMPLCYGSRMSEKLGIPYEPISDEMILKFALKSYL